MFDREKFTSHAGLLLEWKINCDDLTDEDIETLAYIISQKLRFGSVFGIPRGGVRLADALQKYCTEGPRLVVDDVLTTGSSMKEHYTAGDIGIVIFAREKCPWWVDAVFEFGLGSLL